MPSKGLSSKRKWEPCKTEPTETPLKHTSQIITESPAHILRSNSNPSKPKYYLSESEYSISDPETELNNNNEKHGSKKYSACRSSIVKTTCRVNAFTKFFNQKLKPKLTHLHLDLLLETPFHHFFNLPEKWVVSNAVLHLLLECWNENENAFLFNGVKLKFNSKEIGILLGLKHSGFLLSEEEFKSKGESEIQSKYFKKRRYITRKEIEQKLVELVEFSQFSTDFIKVLVLYLFAMVLFPLTQNNVHSYLSHYVDSIENLSNYSWAGAIYNQLEPQLNDLSNWASGRSEGLTYLRGCSLALVVWFYERINQNKLRVAYDQIPRMFNWNLSEQHQRTGNFKEMLDKIPKGKINYQALIPTDEEIIILKEGLFNSNHVLKLSGNVQNESEIMRAIITSNNNVQIQNDVTIAICGNMGLNSSDSALNEECEVRTPIANVSGENEEEIIMGENLNNSNDLDKYDENVAICGNEDYTSSSDEREMKVEIFDSSPSESEHDEMEDSRRNVSSSLFSLFLDKLPSSSNLNPVSSKPIHTKKKQKSVLCDDKIHENGEKESSQNLFYPSNIDETLIPKIGLIFNSLGEALKFYTKYAISSGFKTIKSSSQNHNGKKYRQVLSCQKTRKFKSRGKGLKQKWKSNESIKTDCKARIVLKIYGEESWIITNVELGHNHVISPQKVKIMRFGNNISDISSTPTDSTTTTSPDQIQVNQIRENQIQENQIQESKIQETVFYPSNTTDSLVPNTSMVFDSIDSAFRFYTQYGISSGFLAIKSSFQKNDGKKIRQVLACNKLRKLDSRYEGRKAIRKRRRVGIGRTDCRARVVLKIDESGVWVISEVELGHNHELLSPCEVQILKEKREKMALAKLANPDQKKKIKPKTNHEKESIEENIFYPSNLDESLVPKAGTVFDSTEEAFEFYKKYSISSGFKAIKSSFQKYEGKKYRQVFACQKVRKYKPRLKGEIPLRKTKTMKTDCHARVVIKVNEDDKWEITQVDAGHNHELTPCKEKIQILKFDNYDENNGRVVENNEQN